MKRENMITENLAIGLLDTAKPLVFGVLNTSLYDVMGYIFVAGDSVECLESVGCFPEDIQKADDLKVGEVLYADWHQEKAILIVKMKDDRIIVQ